MALSFKKRLINFNGLGVREDLKKKKVQKVCQNSFKNSYFYVWQILTCDTCYWIYFSWALQVCKFYQCSLISKKAIKHF